MAGPFSRMEICMIDSFKNFERLRYRLSNDINKIATESQKNTESVRGQISNTVFATMFSAFITEIALGSNEGTIDACLAIKLCLLFIIIYVVSYNVYNLLSTFFIERRNNRAIHSTSKGMKELIQIQKDFDNIACDSILMAREYRSAFDALTDELKNKSLKIFYYYEILHYLDVACDKTECLLEHKKDCVRTMDEATGVDIFRVINIKNMMIELDVFLDNEYDTVDDEGLEKEAVTYQHDEVKKKIEKIKEKI